MQRAAASTVAWHVERRSIPLEGLIFMATTIQWLRDELHMIAPRESQALPCVPENGGVYWGPLCWLGAPCGYVARGTPWG